MYEDERVRKLEEEKEALQDALDDKDSLMLKMGKHLADTASIFEEYGGSEASLRSAVSASGRLGEAMEAAATRGWRLNLQMRGVDVSAAKRITPESIREAFEGEDSPTGRWIQEAEEKTLRALAEECSSPEGIRAAIFALHRNE